MARDFAKASGQLAKTDTIDAAVLARRWASQARWAWMSARTRLSEHAPKRFCSMVRMSINCRRRVTNASKNSAASRATTCVMPAGVLSC
jgi:hypothetical protein